MARIRQILFVPPAPIVWAQHLDAFSRHDVDVETTPTLSSDQLGRGLADGSFDVGIGVVDNVLAWNEQFGADLRILAQLERTTVMAFCAAPGIGSLADAAAGSIAVDATTNGFVLVLYRALARAGIDRRHCRFDTVGGVRQRFEALAAGRTGATILVPPFIERATELGCSKLWSGEGIAPDYPGVVAAARAQWLSSERPAALAYLRALLEANAWAAMPGNADQAVAALAAAHYPERSARRLVRDLVPGLAPSLRGWSEVVELRRECGLLAPPGPRAEDVIDRELLACAAGQK
jgi:ABC-type nitrate/sulfonate/bicarbonate transport system substrate-binding protein